MTFLDLKNDLGSLINQTDASGDFVPSFISTEEAERWLNQSYQEVYKWYATANRDRFGVTGFANTVKDQAIYTFGGDAIDLLAIAWVGIKYADDEDYRRAEKTTKTKAFDTGSEIWGKSKPIYFEKQIYNTASGHYELGIEFPEDCIPDASVDDGLKVMYIERPPAMENDADIAEKLPEELHSYIALGGSIKAFKKMGEIEKAEQMTGWFDRSMMGFMSQEQSLSSERVKRIKGNRRDLNKFYRYRT